MNTWHWIRACSAIAMASVIGCSGQGESESAEQKDPAAIVGVSGAMPHHEQPGWGGMMIDGGMMSDGGMMWEGGPIAEGGLIIDSGPKADAGFGQSCKPNSPALTPASNLRGSLTGLLVEHVGLMAVVARAGVPQLEKSPATSVIDQNTVALANIVREAWGPSQAAQFRTLWRLLVQQLLAYAAAVKTGDDAAANAAQQPIEATVDQLAAWAAQADPSLGAGDFKTNLQDNVHLTAASMEAAATGNPAMFTRLQIAARQMTRTAAALSQSIIASHPDQYPGQVQAPPSDLRSALSLLLVGHSYLAWMRTDAAATADQKNEGSKAADVATAGLAMLIKGLGGANRSVTFSKLWKQHANLIEQYGEAIAADDEATAVALREPMRTTTLQIVGLLGSISPGADQGALFTELERHEASLIAAMHARLESDASLFRAVREAGQDAINLSKWLSGELSASFPADLQPGTLPPLNP